MRHWETLRDAIISAFTREDLKSACLFDLDIDIDMEIRGGSSYVNQVTELIRYLQHRGSVENFIASVRRRRAENVDFLNQLNEWERLEQESANSNIVNMNRSGDISSLKREILSLFANLKDHTALNKILDFGVSFRLAPEYEDRAVILCRAYRSEFNQYSKTCLAEGRIASSIDDYETPNSDHSRKGLKLLRDMIDSIVSLELAA